MASYLLIESRDPFEDNEVGHFYALASDLAQAGNDVALFLVQNGVFPARPGARSGDLQALARRVSVVADDFSLRERGIASDRLVPGVKPASLDVVVDRLAAGARALWH